MVSQAGYYFLFEVIVDNGLKGTQFVLNGNEIFPALNFHKRYVTVSMRGRNETTVSGFKIKMIPEKEIHQYHRGVPEEVEKLRKKNKRYGQSHVVPIIGKINIGIYAGLEFSFFGSQDIPPFFSQGVISLVINGRVKQHKGCTFRTASHKEAMQFHGNFTQDVIDDLSQYNNMIKPIIAIPMRGKYKGIEYPIVSANKVNEFFNSSLVRGVVTGHKTSYMGFMFMDTDYKDIEGNTNVLTRDVFEETVDALKVPYIGRILKGELAGQEFGFIYKSVIEKYLTVRLVQSVIRGDRKSYKGCTFESASYHTAAELTANLTPVIIQYLESKSRS